MVFSAFLPKVIYRKKSIEEQKISVFQNFFLKVFMQIDDTPAIKYQLRNDCKEAVGYKFMVHLRNIMNLSQVSKTELFIVINSLDLLIFYKFWMISDPVTLRTRVLEMCT